MRFMVSCGVYLAVLVTTVSANTEKAIFKAPDAYRLPDTKPGVDYLDIPSLKHGDQPLQTSLSVAFPEGSITAGHNHWYLLRNLVPSKRYELRICWSATQPTSFRLDTYTISDVFDDALLIRDLAKTAPTPDSRSPHSGKSTEGEIGSVTAESILYLRVQAAADYYSLNKTLMLHPPRVDVDIILDPYIASIVPESLVPTILYLLALGLIARILSKGVWTLLSSRSTSKPHTD